MNVLLRIYHSLVTQVRGINTRYAKPSIQMTPLVRISLLFLRFYLFLLVGLLIYRFIIAVKQ
jgi:hypothetical protein